MSTANKLQFFLEPKCWTETDLNIYSGGQSINMIINSDIYPAEMSTTGVMLVGLSSTG